MYQLLAWADDNQVSLDHLQARSSSLADVFRQLAADTDPTPAKETP